MLPGAEKIPKETDIVGIRTILFVDDDDSIRAVISMGLEHFNYQVVTAFDAASALEVLGQNQVDLIIMDNGLPGVEGVELGIEILRQPQYANLPIVLFTGTRDRELDRRARAAGFVDCWVKPMGLKIMQQKLEALVSSKGNDPHS